MFYQGVFGGLEGASGQLRPMGLGTPPGGLENIDPNPPFGQATFDPCDLFGLTPMQRKDLGCDPTISRTVSGSTRGQSFERTVSGSTRGQTTSNTVSGRRSLAVPDPETWGACASEIAGSSQRLADSCGAPYIGDCGPFSDDVVKEANRSLDIAFAFPGLAMVNGFFGPLQDLLSPLTELWESKRNAEEREFLELAWTYLIQNEHLILWAACMIGDADAGVQIIKKLTRPGKVDIVISDFNVCELGGSGICTYIDVFYGFQEVIHIGRTRQFWKCFVDTFRESKQCGGIWLASVLLHELWHMVREFRFGDSFKNECFPAILLQNMFSWALLSSCQGAASQPTCVNLLSDASDPFYQGENRWPC